MYNFNFHQKICNAPTELVWWLLSIVMTTQWEKQRISIQICCSPKTANNSSQTIITSAKLFLLETNFDQIVIWSSLWQFACCQTANLAEKRKHVQAYSVSLLWKEHWFNYAYSFCGWSVLWLFCFVYGRFQANSKRILPHWIAECIWQTLCSCLWFNQAALLCLTMFISVLTLLSWICFVDKKFSVQKYRPATIAEFKAMPLCICVCVCVCVCVCGGERTNAIIFLKINRIWQKSFDGPVIPSQSGGQIRLSREWVWSVISQMVPESCVQGDAIPALRGGGGSPLSHLWTTAALGAHWVLEPTIFMMGQA